MRFDLIRHLDEGESVSETFSTTRVKVHLLRERKTSDCTINTQINKISFIAPAHILLFRMTTNLYELHSITDFCEYFLAFVRLKITLNCLQRQGKNYFRMVINEKAIVYT